MPLQSTERRREGVTLEVREMVRETAAVAFGVTDLGAGRGACVLGPTCIGSQYILQVFIPRLQLCTTQRRHAGGVHPLRSHPNQSAATHRHDDSTHSYTQHTRPGPEIN